VSGFREKRIVPNRWLLATLIGGCCTFTVSVALALTVHVQIFPLTGEIQLRNKSAAPFPFTFYSIASKSGSLNSSPGVWRSISDNYDASGNGFIDPINNWNKISAPGSTTELSEGVVPDPGGTLPAMRAISLGRVWNPNTVPVPDLVVEVLEPDDEPASVFVEFALAGDYLPDGIVNQTDYNIWRQYFGSTAVLLADGNLNGIVDAADYALWRDNLGKSIPSGSGSSRSALVVGGAIPEPTSAALVMLGFGPILAWISRRVRR
jgi:hypothetical protein